MCAGSMPTPDLPGERVGNACPVLLTTAMKFICYVQYRLAITVNNGTQ